MRHQQEERDRVTKLAADIEEERRNKAQRKVEEREAAMKVIKDNLNEKKKRMAEQEASKKKDAEQVERNMRIALEKEIAREEEMAERGRLVRMPIFNAVVFGTDEGLVVVDTGMAPAGPALLEAIRSVSDAQIHTIIYTHGHVDHAYGTWV